VARADILVSTEWVHENLLRRDLCIVEVSVCSSAYETAHLPGALAWNWATQLCDGRIRDIMGKAQLEALLGSSGITPDTTVILYGDNHNWFAAWALWQLKLYGHADVRIMDGGKMKWMEEERPLTIDSPMPQPVLYRAADADLSSRAFRSELADRYQHPAVALVDVRTPQEFSGELLSPPGLTECCQRGGHIPGAVNIPWTSVFGEDGTLRDDDWLLRFYGERGVVPEKRVITYCRIGERSAHTWYVLKYVLGYPDVANYDGSWVEWGNLVQSPIAVGSE
jgi:thiosulfate/3-mercaptopyruvate sulfurtransferase